MTYRDSKILTAKARGQIQLKFAKRAAKLVNVFQCLIVAADPARRQMFERAATDGGWKSFPCADAATALTTINRSLVQLAIIDLEAGGRSAFRPVVESLKGRSGLLLVVCGNEGDVEEEVWVRQLGAWLYLPGVVDTSDFGLLCGEARHIAERLWKTANPERVAGPPAAQRPSYS